MLEAYVCNAIDISSTVPSIKASHALWSFRATWKVHVRDQSTIISETATMLTDYAHTLAKMPSTSSHPAAANPVCRAAQRVSEMTPLFCAKVVVGKIVPSAAKRADRPSLSRPP